MHEGYNKELISVSHVWEKQIKKKKYVDYQDLSWLGDLKQLTWTSSWRNSEDCLRSMSDISLPNV